MKIDPLTWPATADDSAVTDHPLPQGGEGIFMKRSEPKDQEACAQDDSRALRGDRGEEIL